MLVSLRSVAESLGVLLLMLSGALLLPMGVALGYGEAVWWSFGVAALLAGGLGGSLRYFFRSYKALGIRDGFVIVALAWFVLSLITALPFVMTGILPDYSTAFFETVSGFTTTGATILGGPNTPAIEDLPNSFLFLRSLTHWMGGMGIIVMVLAIMPMMGVGGVQLFKAEVTGPETDKLTPRIRDTASQLWLIYLGMTLLIFLLLLPAMAPFDALNHAFSTAATGGFSTKNASVGHFGSAYVEWVIILFMFLGGINYALYFNVLRGRTNALWPNEEGAIYGLVVLMAIAIVTLALFRPVAEVLPPTMGAPETLSATYPSFWTALRVAAFQVVATVTTTGYGVADYELWPALAFGVLFLMYFTGGMVGSTSGGVKILRVVLLMKNGIRENKRLIHPKAIIPVRLNDRPVPEETIRRVLTFLVLFLALVFLGTLVLALLGLDFMSAFAGTLASLTNVGPAFGTFGPTENFAHLPALGKWFLALLMITGRLEIFTVLVIFTRAFWRR